MDEAGQNCFPSLDLNIESKFTHDVRREMSLLFSTWEAYARELDLHDEQQLRQLASLQPSSTMVLPLLVSGQAYALDKIKSALCLVDETIQLARRISTELRPGVLDNLGLEAAVNWHLREFEKRSGVRCELKAVVDEAALTHETSTATFRILQEALTNVARHAKASQVRVTLETSSDKLILLVQDNGVGITDERRQNSKSLGVLGMHERAIALGGAVELNDAPHRGTTMMLTLPLGKNGLNRD